MDSKIHLPSKGLAGFFRANHALDQYGFFLNWRVTLDPSNRGKTPAYLVEADPFYLPRLPPQIEEGEPIRVHLFLHSTNDTGKTAPIGCAVGLCEIITDLGLVAFGMLERSILEFRIMHVLEYVPQAIDTDLNLKILQRLVR